MWALPRSRSRTTPPTRKSPHSSITSFSQGKRSRSSAMTRLSPMISCRPPLSREKCRGRESNPHEAMLQRILSPLRLPVPPPRQFHYQLQDSITPDKREKEISAVEWFLNRLLCERNKASKRADIDRNSTVMERNDAGRHPISGVKRWQTQSETR